MEAQNVKKSTAFGGLIFILVLTAACTFLEGKTEPTTAQPGGEGFTFKAPFGYRVVEQQGLKDSWMEAENLLFAQKEPVYFIIYRMDIPSGSSLDEVFDLHQGKEEPEANHYQSISRQEVQVFDRRAIEHVYAHFHGEPYVRTRETWVENVDQIYILACSQTINADKAKDPVSEECDRLLEGFEFK
ncbi:MAG: hypothetical protein AB9891_07255 [Anaerolineaceae bacterium]